ncbi:glycerophosphodiester phosphodiesterase family protein [Corynebacterium dentalis]|uniref:glycerophosphodiester phosphodiesterase family protein n=1 Tax=Corynebacterium dentalis TaxID=2014528 RepID=UPI00370DDBCD
MRSWDKNGNLGLSTFWLRRFRRLLPAVIHTLVSVLIVTASLRKQDLGSRLAERSYCIYLCHMPVIAFMPHSWLEQHQFWASLIKVVVSVLLAAVSWSWIEDPIRKDGIVESVRAWRRTQNERPFPTRVGAGAAVIVPAIVGSTPTSSAAPATGLDPNERPTAPAPTTEAAASDEQNTMSCTQVIHVGDSTPIGMFSTAMVNDPTETATANDPEFPYVGKLVHELNWDQLQTLNCDKKLSGFPDVEPVKGNKLLQLQDVFDIAAADPQVHFNIETKIEAENREDSATPEEFVNVIVPVIQQNNAVDRSAIQSFDWRSLPLAHQSAPELDIVALYDETTWKDNSVWIEPINYDDVHGDVVAAAEQLGANVLSPNFKLVNQQNVQWAHQHGIQVIPWTVNESDDINRIIDTGVDGLITDYPTRATEILNSRGITIA